MTSQLPARFSNEFQGAELLDGARPESACVRRTQPTPRIGSWETTSTITVVRPPPAFAYESTRTTARRRPGASLDPTAEGTRLTQWMRMGPARSGINLAIDAMPDKESKILHRRLAEHRTNMGATLAGIKALAEA